MKILLREYGVEQYVWKTAKYNNGNFLVDGCTQRKSNIVSIMNDNRKNYIQCSCCGQVFRKGDKRFQQHKENAIKPETCFGCGYLSTHEMYEEKRKIVRNFDGSFSEKIERTVDLRCDSASFWSSHSITSDEAIRRCKKRQCASATEVEIEDFFTSHPGAFDDIITIDSILDEGYDVGITSGRSGEAYDLVYEDDYTLGVYINKIGIVTHFYVWIDGDKYWFNYSKKYDELFSDHREYGYEIFDIYELTTEKRDEIKELIRKFYC